MPLCMLKYLTSSPAAVRAVAGAADATQIPQSFPLFLIKNSVISIPPESKEIPTGTELPVGFIIVKYLS